MSQLPLLKDRTMIYAEFRKLAALDWEDNLTDKDVVGWIKSSDLHWEEIGRVCGVAMFRAYHGDDLIRLTIAEYSSDKNRLEYISRIVAQAPNTDAVVVQSYDVVSEKTIIFGKRGQAGLLKHLR